MGMKEEVKGFLHFFNHHLSMTLLSTLRSLIPLRIAHHPSVVLEVVVSDGNQDTNDNQEDPSIEASQSNDSHLVDGDLVATDPSLEALCTAASQAPLEGPRDEIGVQWPSPSTSRYQEKTDNKRNMLEQLQQLQQQMEDLLGKVQQNGEQAQSTQQQLLDPIEKILRTSREMDQHHTEQIQRMTQLSDLQTQQFEAVLQTLQLQSEEVMGHADQRTQQIKEEQQFMQLLQHLFVEILDKVQQLDQHNQQLGIIRQDLQQTSQRTHASQYQLRQEIRQVQQKLQQMEPQAQQSQQSRYQHLFDEPQRTVQQQLKDVSLRFLACFDTSLPALVAFIVAKLLLDKLQELYKPERRR